MNAASGNLADGFAFAGAKAYLSQEIIAVEDVMQSLAGAIREY